MFSPCLQGVFTLNSFTERSDMMSQHLPDLLPNYDTYTPGGVRDCFYCSLYNYNDNHFIQIFTFSSLNEKVFAPDTDKHRGMVIV